MPARRRLGLRRLADALQQPAAVVLDDDGRKSTAGLAAVAKPHGRRAIDYGHVVSHRPDRLHVDIDRSLGILGEQRGEHAANFLAATGHIAGVEVEVLPVLAPVTDDRGGIVPVEVAEVQAEHGGDLTPLGLILCDPASRRR